MQLLKEVSLGNLLSVGTIIVAAAVTWGVTSNRVSSTEIKLADTDKKVEKINEEAARTNAKTGADISIMNTTIGRMDERMKGMERSLDKQELMLQEIVKKLK